MSVSDRPKLSIEAFKLVESLTPITSAILIIAAVAASGLVIGGIRLRGIGLGPAGVLFAGILFGHFGLSIDADIALFAKEFGLILFVFTIGLQLGPGIVQLWKKSGLMLNMLAASIVGQGFVLIITCYFLFGFSVFSTAGLFSGSTTNTPSLGAAEQAATMRNATPDNIETLASAYAVAYPGGILGIITSMLLIRFLCRINVPTELKRLREVEKADHEPIERRSIIFDNANLSGIAFGKIPGIEETGVRISRIKRAPDQDVHPATEETVLCEGDVFQVVGTRDGLDRFTPLVGRISDVDLMQSAGDAESRRVFVTEPDALNRPLSDLSLDKIYNVSVTRIRRAGVEMTPRGASRFYFGDLAQVVGDRESLDRATAFLGNSGKSVKETRFAPLFLGIAGGVVLGIIPFHLPGIPFPVRLGLAGGPLVAAILLSLVGSVGKFVWYIPFSANLALRELGIILFLACAGLSAGRTFFAVAMSLDGITWMLAGLVVTMVPLLTTGIAARLWFKQNYLTICGTIAGSMTDPPALAFANAQADTEACSTSYATVYPLTMILRIIAAQAIIFLLV